MPVTAEISGHLGDTSGTSTYLGGHPPPGSVGHGHARRRDAGVLFCPRPHGAVRIRATPPSLVPVEPRGLAEDRKIDEDDIAPALQLRHYAAGRTADGLCWLLDVELHVRAQGVHAEYGHLWEPDDELQCLLRISLEFCG